MKSTPATQPASDKIKGWLESMNTSLGIDDFLKNFNLSKEVVVETLFYFAAGFAIGFFGKRYLRHVVIAIVLLVIMLKGMEMAGVGIITLNWFRIKELTGVAPSDSLSSIFAVYLAWLQTHVRQSVAIVVGIVIGSRVG